MGAVTVRGNRSLTFLALSLFLLGDNQPAFLLVSCLGIISLLCSAQSVSYVERSLMNRKHIFPVLIAEVLYISKDT